MPVGYCMEIMTGHAALCSVWCIPHDHSDWHQTLRYVKNVKRGSCDKLFIFYNTFRLLFECHIPNKGIYHILFSMLSASISGGFRGGPRGPGPPFSDPSLHRIYYLEGKWMNNLTIYLLNLIKKVQFFSKFSARFARPSCFLLYF